MSHLFKRFRRDIIGLVWLSIGIFIMMALYSYRPTDPSLNTIGGTVKVQNFCGYFGSFLSDILFQVFGLSAWLICAGCLRLSWRNFKGEEFKSVHLRWLWAALLMVTTSSLLSLYWPGESLFMSQISPGGVLGKLLSGALVGVFSKIGVAIILWTAALILTIFYTEKRLDEIFSLPRILVIAIANTIFKKNGIAKVWHSFEALFGAIWVGLQKIAKAPELVTESARLRGELTVKKSNFLPIMNRGGQTIPAREMQANDFDSYEASTPSGKEIEADAGEKETESVDNKSEDADPNKKRPIRLKKKVQMRIENWILPKLSILEDPPYNRKRVEEKEVRDKAQRLSNKLKHFGITGEVVGAKPGPAVTMFEYKPNADVKISRITDLADDLSLELSSESVRIIAPIPGRDVVGIETSNSCRETVFLKEILASDEFWDEKISLPLALGCQADGQHKVVDLRKMPHLLVAGTTGSGKSVFVVSMLTGLLFRHSPKTLRLILVDPKQVDLAAFSKLPHLLMPPIREPKKAITALRWSIKEMERRYRSMAKFGARDLESFNKKVSQLSSSELAECESQNAEIEAAQTGQGYYFTPQPYTIIIVEEFGDLMSVDKSNVEQSVVRLAQMARACGIHLILAMQSPRKDVVTGLIKTNIPGRVSFKVASKMDSRIILDESGAERLLSRGDMLYLAPGVSKPQRHHGPWLTDAEIQAVCQFWTSQAEPEYDPNVLRLLEGPGHSSKEGSEEWSIDDIGEDSFDDRYDEILAYVGTLKEVSASHIQTRFRLGYPRAARLIEVFEQQGVVGPASGSKKRQVLINELK